MSFTVKKLHPDAIVPTRGSKKSSGLDLYALEDVLMYVNETKIIKTGIAFGIPEGYEVQVRPRSGLSLKTGLTIPNSPGTIDQDYTGECAVIMRLSPTNNTVSSYQIKRGDRIAQAVLCPVTIEDLIEVNDLDETERGSNGYGSTGK